jgi:spore coat polysaccharide biosynthesis protein SpsF
MMRTADAVTNGSPSISDPRQVAFTKEHHYMNKDYIVLQVRLESTRLPGKLLLPLCGITIFEHILMRLSRARDPDGIIVATTASTAPQIVQTAKRYGARIVIGSENDVLSRYLKAVSTYRISNVIRATGDNPLVCVEYIDKALRLHRSEGADLTTYPILPYGTGVEVIKGAIFDKLAHLTQNPFDREHVTQYIYRHPTQFRIVLGTPRPELQRRELRLTVDTSEDYKRMVEIYSALYRGDPLLLARVIEYLDRKGMV